MIQELCIGANMLSIAVGGLILTVVGALSGGETGSAPPMLWYGLGLFGLVIHVAALYVGTWKIFRARDRWPFAFASVATGLAVVWMVSALLFAGTGEWRAERSIMFLIVRGVGMTWAAYECFRYSAMLRKRAAVGLGDLFIAHRISLWGFAAVASSITILLDIATWGWSGQALAATSAGLHAMSLLGFVATCGIAFAFFPPAFYVRMIERRSAGDNSTA